MAIISSAPAADAAGPCPQYSIDQVLADPEGDWDRDRIGNRDEIYKTGSNPCARDSAIHCNNGSIYCRAPYPPTKTQCRIHSIVWPAIQANPNGDWDGDGISNTVEYRSGANPCSAPCPRPLTVDVLLNPNADWDDDGLSNGRELLLGTNPCKKNVVTRVAPAPRLPHVQTLVPKPAPVPTPAPAPVVPVHCPAGYPYFHPDTGLCYANPIRPQY